jgi:hypothetical protein
MLARIVVISYGDRRRTAASTSVSDPGQSHHTSMPESRLPPDSSHTGLTEASAPLLAPMLEIHSPEIAAAVAHSKNMGTWPQQLQ